MGNCRFLRQKKQVLVNGEWVDTRSFRYLPLCDESHSIVSIIGGLKNHIYNVELVGGGNQIETSNTGSGSIEIAPTAIIIGVSDIDTSMGSPFTDAVQIYNCKIKRLNSTKTRKLKIYCSSLLDCEHINGYSYGNFGGSYFSEIYLEPSAVSNLTTMEYMFSHCHSLTSLDVSNWNTSNVTSMACMFKGCSNLTSLDVSNWNTSKIINMYEMFAGCSSLKSLNVSGLDITNPSTLANMFNGCSSLVSLDLSSWDTSYIITMDYMFRGCSSLVSLNISGWDMTKVKIKSNMRGMFTDCSKLSTIRMIGCNQTTIDKIKKALSNAYILDQVTIIT